MGGRVVQDALGNGPGGEAQSTDEQQHPGDAPEDPRSGLQQPYHGQTEDDES